MPSEVVSHARDPEDLHAPAVRPERDVVEEGAGTRPDAATPKDARRNSVMTLLAVVLIGFILYVGQGVLLPLSLATLIAFLVSPICDWLEHHRLPRVAATIVVVTFIAGIIAGIGVALYGGLRLMGDNWEAYSDRIVAKAQRLSSTPAQGEAGAGKAGAGGGGVGQLASGIGETFARATEAATTGAVEAVEAVDDAAGTGLTDDDATGDDFATATLRRVKVGIEGLATREGEREAAISELAGELTAGIEALRGDLRTGEVRVVEQQLPPTSVERAGQVLVILAGPIGTMGLIAVFLLFILLQRDDLRDRVIKLAAGRRINLATQALDDASRRISRYLRAQAIVNGTYGIAIAFGLLGISYAFAGEWFPGVILWGVLCAVLRFIPYLGPWLAAAFPLFVSLGHYEGLTVFLVVVAMFVIVELISNNVMEPILYGSAVGMSDFAVIIAATFWAFIWGPVGLLVATPLTTCLVVLGKYVPALKPFDTLLGNEPVLTPHSRLYQRLLALDTNDADDEVEEFRKDNSLTETFDDLMLPALLLAERDREAGNLTDERVTFIADFMKRTVASLAEQDEALPSDSVDLGDAAPAPEEDKLVSDYLARAQVVLLPASDAADEFAADMLAALLRRRGYTAAVVDDDALASEKLAAAREASVIVISSVPPRAAVRARYLVKKLEACDGPKNAQTLVGVWDKAGDAKQLRRQVCGSSSTGVLVVTSLASAVEQVRQKAEISAARRGELVESR